MDSRLLCFQMCSSAVMAMHSSSGIPWVPVTQPTFLRQYTTSSAMTAGGREFSGQVCLANADETGVYLLCYGVRDGSPAEAELTQLCQASLESISFD